MANTNMDLCSLYVLAVASVLFVVGGEKCGYVRGPLAATNDTVVIKLDCKQSTPSSHNVSLQLRDNATHVAVQLVHCHTVPVGLFTNVTDNLTSVTVASEDAVQLLEGTFEGLGHVTELRLLGFSSLINLSVSLFEPVTNIKTLILDGFGKSNVKLSHLGSAIQKLSKTPIKRLVLNDMRDETSTKLLEGRRMRAGDFKIMNASVKELIISNTPMLYEGSIRRAFPHLTCFHGSQDKVPTEMSIPVMYDLLILSDTLTEFHLCRYKQYGRTSKILNMTANDMFALFLGTAERYPDLLSHFLDRPAADDCSLGFKLQLGPNISNITVNRLKIFTDNVQKPLCFEQNKLGYLDLSGCPLPEHFAGIRGFTKLKYLSLANSLIKSLANDFLHYFPMLEVLKLSELDIEEFIESIDGNFFAFSYALAEIHLDNCHLTDVSSTLTSALGRQRTKKTTPSLSDKVESVVLNHTRIRFLNFSRNNIKRINQRSIDQLSELALRKPKGSELFVELSYNDLQCLCNSTHFLKWLQRSPTDSNIKFPGFDIYRCSYPNGSLIRVSEIIISELEQQCSVTQTLVNGSDCPCDEELRGRLQQVRMSLDGFFCRSDDGEFVAMKNNPFPSCFMTSSPLWRASFIAAVVIGGIFVLAMLVVIGLLIYYRNSRRVRQARDCLPPMNPATVVRMALQYVMTQNSGEEHAIFRHDMFVFVQEDDQSSIHRLFLEALQGNDRPISAITRDNILPGMTELDTILEYISECRWIVPVITPNFLSDRECLHFISRVQFRRRPSVIPVVWDQPLDLDVTDAVVQDLLQTGEPLYWPGDLATVEEKRNFWSSLLERMTEFDGL